MFSSCGHICIFVCLYIAPFTASSCVIYTSYVFDYEGEKKLCKYCQEIVAVGRSPWRRAMHSRKKFPALSACHGCYRDVTKSTKYKHTSTYVHIVFVVCWKHSRLKCEKCSYFSHMILFRTLSFSSLFALFSLLHSIRAWIFFFVCVLICMLFYTSGEMSFKCVCAECAFRKHSGCFHIKLQHLT